MRTDCSGARPIAWRAGLLAFAWSASAAVALALSDVRTARAEDGAPPPVRLDRLLKLPEGVEYDMERRGGATRTEWRGRFKAAQAEVAVVKKELDAAVAKLEKAAAGSDQWRFVPPGGDVAAENQDNLRLRMEVTRKRDDLAHAEKQLSDLKVEANLAAVPEDWRQ